jgi:DNA-binding NtrC family response regulator
LKRTFAPTNSSVAFWSPKSTTHSNRGSRATAAPLIYAVDDLPCLTELYALILNASGYVVKGFHDRRAALASLSAAEEKPVLLITDLHNPTMRIEPFLKECAALHPALRILMATGFSYHHAWCFSVRPDHFLQKPFTPEELRQAVAATLAGEIAESLS